MKIAVGLIGTYSEYWKKNIEYLQADLFLCSYGEITDDLSEYEVKNKYVLEDIPNLLNIHEAAKPGYVCNQTTASCENIINNYERENNFKYDVYIYTYFTTLLCEFPTKPGTYKATMNATHDNEKLKNFQIISDTHVQFDDNIGDRKPLEACSDDERQLIYTKLYGDRVSDINRFVEMEEEVIFLIPSVINVSSKPFNYYTLGKRSIFSHKERFEQTLLQVKTMTQIKDVKYKSIILEGSILPFSQMDELTKYSNIVLFVYDKDGNYHANENPNKSVYELYAMRKIFDKIKFNWVFKFGGRYRLQSTFDINKFLKKNAVFRVLPGSITYTGKPLAECILYSIPKKQKGKYKIVFDEMIERLKEDDSLSVEDLFYRYSINFNTVETCNVIGKDGVYGHDKFQ